MGTINQTVVQGGDAINNLTSALTIGSNVLTFSATGDLSGVAVSIPETTYTLTPSTYAQSISGWIVQDTSSGTVSLMVDEVLWDGVSHIFGFGHGNTLKPLGTLFFCKVPANATTFDAVEVRLLSIVVPPPPPPPQPFILVPG